MRTPEEIADILCETNIPGGNASAAALLAAWRDECVDWREAALVERIIASLRHTAHDGKWQNVDEAEIIIREAARRQA